MQIPTTRRWTGTTALLLASLLFGLPTPRCDIPLQRFRCAELGRAESWAPGRRRLPREARVCAIRRLHVWGGLSGAQLLLANAENFHRVGAVGSLVPLIAMRGGAGVKRRRPVAAGPTVELEGADDEQDEVGQDRSGAKGVEIEEEGDEYSETVLPGGSSSDEAFSFHS